MAVKTRIGKKFLEIIDQCFPLGHILRPHFSRHIVKLSYRTLANMYTKTNVQNHKITQAYNEANKPPAPPRRWRGRLTTATSWTVYPGDPGRSGCGTWWRQCAGAAGKQHPHQPQQQQAGCNCDTVVENCPMDGNCLVTNVVYAPVI